MRYYIFWGLIIIIVACNNKREHLETNEVQESKLSTIQDVNKYKEKYNVVRLNKLNLKLEYLFFLTTCGFKYKQDSVASVGSYIIYFSDSSNTQVEVLKLKSLAYGKYLVNYLDPMVKKIRNFNRMESRGFCVPETYNRIYNYDLKNDTLYLFGYDSSKPKYEDEEVSMASSGKLKNLDRICEALE